MRTAANIGWSQTADVHGVSSVANLIKINSNKKLFPAKIDPGNGN